MFKKLFKKITGLQALEDAKVLATAEVAVAEKLAAQKIKEAVAAQDALDEVKRTPKERATIRKEAWVNVMDTKVNKDNPRNGFFELDWNEYFITELKKNGYGFDGDPEEEIVDRWFRDIVRNMLSDEGMDANRSAGFINVTRLADNKAQVE
jgi:CRISPR/Cas system Type II protein with McrA/HNH and RuvC-like nuclease domain